MLMKQVEGMTEERDYIVYDENQQCWNTSYPNFRMWFSFMVVFPVLK